MPIALLDGYRNRVTSKKKPTIEAMIREEEDREKVETQRKRHKRVKNVYLVNRNKFWVEVNATDLQKEVDIENMDESSHKILQHRIRK